MTRMRKLWILAVAVVTVLAATAGFAVVPPEGGGLRDNAFAATELTVTTTADEVTDDDECSLREAVIFANTGGVGAEDACGTDGGNPYTINLDAATYTLMIPGDDDTAAVGDLDITDDTEIVIQGQGAASTIIEACTVAQHFTACTDTGIEDRVFHLVSSGASLTLNGVTVRHGRADGGGGIYNFGASLTLDGSSVTENTATDDGGGILAVEADGIGSLVEILNGSSVTENTTTHHGGGIYQNGVFPPNFDTITLWIVDSTIDGNTADRGGGLFLALATVTILRSTVSDNTSIQEGGGIYSAGSLTVTNSTLSGNVHGGPFVGGAIYNTGGTATLTNVTVKNNGHSNALFSDGNNPPTTGTITLKNSTVAGNFNLDCNGQPGTFISEGFNLVGNGHGWCVTNGVNGDIAGTTTNPIDALLGDLQANGGPTETHALLPGSPAIDGVGDGFCTLDEDQRGELRPVDGDDDDEALCDMGAFELRDAGEPAMTFDPPGLDFGEIPVGSTGGPLTATLHNTGDVELTGLVFSLPENGFQADTDACGETLAVEEDCPVMVTFAPAQPGPATAGLEVTSAEEVSVSLSLDGAGVGAPALTPAALAVDAGTPLSDGNGVFEPGESVDVAPAWRNDGEVATSLAGQASDFQGPEGAAYTLELDAAEYGAVDSGATASCQDTGVCYRMAVDDPAARPATHWEASFVETLDDPDETARPWTLHLGDSFADVPRTSLFYRGIETLLHSGVTGGCGDGGDYCPAGANTRSQMPAFMLRALMGPDYTPPACDEGEERMFDDVPATNLFCPWIEDLANRGIVSGCGNDSYCPSDAVTRAQMAIFLLKTLEGPDYEPTECTNRFTDVPCSSIFADWIEDLAVREITGGCSETEYCPSDAVTRGQMASFITKTFGFTLYGP